MDLQTLHFSLRNHYVQNYLTFPNKRGLEISFHKQDLSSIKSIFKPLALVFHIGRKFLIDEILLIWILTFKSSLIIAILIVKLWIYDKPILVLRV